MPRVPAAPPGAPTALPAARPERFPAPRPRRLKSGGAQSQGTVPNPPSVQTLPEPEHTCRANTPGPPGVGSGRAGLGLADTPGPLSRRGPLLGLGGCAVPDTIRHDV